MEELETHPNPFGKPTEMRHSQKTSLAMGEYPQGILANIQKWDIDTFHYQRTADIGRVSVNPESLHQIASQLREPPYAERHVWWCERPENESRKKTTSFSSYLIFFLYIYASIMTAVSLVLEGKQAGVVGLNFSGETKKH